MWSCDHLVEIGTTVDVAMPRDPGDITTAAVLPNHVRLPRRRNLRLRDVVMRQPKPRVVARAPRPERRIRINQRPNPKGPLHGVKERLHVPINLTRRDIHRLDVTDGL